MRRILLVAEGTPHRPVVHTLAIAAGISVTLLAGVAILRSGLPGWATLGAIALLLVAVAYVNGRYGSPRMMRVEKPAEGGGLRVVGRFDNGEIPSGRPATLEHLTLTARGMELQVAGYPPMRLSSPAFSREAMERLETTVRSMESDPEEQLRARIEHGAPGVRIHDAGKLLLLRYVQKPAYMTLLWLVSGVTVMVWLLLGALMPV